MMCRTLIIKEMDAVVVAGGQAENFFNDGLANKHDSVLIRYFLEWDTFGETSMPMATFRAGKKNKDSKSFQILVKNFWKTLGFDFSPRS